MIQFDEYFSNGLKPPPAVVMVFYCRGAFFLKRQTSQTCGSVETNPSKVFRRRVEYGRKGRGYSIHYLYALSDHSTESHDTNILHLWQWFARYSFSNQILVFWFQQRSWVITILWEIELQQQIFGNQAILRDFRFMALCLGWCHIVTPRFWSNCSSPLGSRNFKQRHGGMSATI